MGAAGTEPGPRDPATGRAAVASLAALAVLAACRGGGPPAEEGPLRPLHPPAAEGSGEPNLSVGPDGGVHLSWLEPVPGGDAHRLRLAVLGGGAGPVPGLGWSGPRTVAEGVDFFVNWADFPSVLALPDGTLAAHWLQRNGTGTYAYGVRVALSRDGGATWTDPVVPHDDGTPTEHGFVSLFPDPSGGLGMVWLDGRDFASGEEGETRSPTEAEMSLRYARLPVAGAPAPAGGGGTGGGGTGDPGASPVRDDALVDGRVCDCCQTSVALTGSGPLLVYRDRSRGEIRDVHASRLGPGGWSEPRAVHADGWEIPACPVYGPSGDARGSRAAVAWFTAARDTPRVRLSFSSDGGGSFAPPIRVDLGRPAGRVDVVLAPDGTAVVSWLEVREAKAELLLRRIAEGGETGPPVAAAASSASRSAGFPRMVRSGDRLVLAWTDPSAGGGVRAGWLPLEAVPRP